MENQVNESAFTDKCGNKTNFGEIQLSHLSSTLSNFVKTNNTQTIIDTSQLLHMQEQI